MSDLDARAAADHFAEPAFLPSPRPSHMKPTAKAFDRHAHLQHLKALADAYEAKRAAMFGFTVTDRTPAGYGPRG